MYYIKKKKVFLMLPNTLIKVGILVALPFFADYYTECDFFHMLCCFL